MTQDEIIEMVRKAGWSGIYTQWAEPTGEADWSPYKVSLTVPVTMEQIEAFAKLVAAKAIAELESQERNFCPRCGKRTNDIHTCTPPQEKNT